MCVCDLIDRLIVFVIVMVIQEEVEAQEVEAKEDAPALDLEAEFDKLFQPYANYSGIEKDEIDDELREAQESFSKLRKKGRHETPEGQELQKKIDDFERLVELRDLINTSNDQSWIQELRSEIDKVLRTINEIDASGKSRDDLHNELVKARERIATLRSNGLDGISTEVDELQRRITDLDRLVELSGVLSAERNSFATDTEDMGSHPHTEVTSVGDESKEHHDNAGCDESVDTNEHVGTNSTCCNIL